MTALFRRTAPALIALAAIAATSAPAQANLLTNGSFETAVPALASNAYCYSCINGGWTGGAPVIKSNSSAWGRNGQGPQALGGYSYGTQLVGLQNNSYIEQTLNLAAGTYLLTWADAGRINYQSTQYNVMFDGDVLNATRYGTSAGQAWSTRSLSFTAAGTGALRFQGLAVNNDGTAFIDNLSLTLTAAAPQVPEPASIALVALALAGVAASSRRRA